MAGLADLLGLVARQGLRGSRFPPEDLLAMQEARARGGAPPAVRTETLAAPGERQRFMELLRARMGAMREFEDWQAQNPVASAEDYLRGLVENAEQARRMDLERYRQGQETERQRERLGAAGAEAEQMRKWREEEARVSAEAARFEREWLHEERTARGEAAKTEAEARERDRAARLALSERQFGAARKEAVEKDELAKRWLSIAEARASGETPWQLRQRLDKQLKDARGELLSVSEKIMQHTDPSRIRFEEPEEVFAETIEKYKRRQAALEAEIVNLSETIGSMGPEMGPPMSEALGPPPPWAAPGTGGGPGLGVGDRAPRWGPAGKLVPGAGGLPFIPAEVGVERGRGEAGGLGGHAGGGPAGLRRAPATPYMPTTEEYAAFPRTPEWADRNDRLIGEAARSALGPWVEAGRREYGPPARRAAGALGRMAESAGDILRQRAQEMRGLGAAAQGALSPGTSRGWQLEQPDPRFAPAVTLRTKRPAEPYGDLRNIGPAEMQGAPIRSQPMDEYKDALRWWVALNRPRIEEQRARVLGRLGMRA